ncbi:MAG: hypothetical protein ACRCU3_04750 [Eubacteriaceae bacterium]
MNDGLKNQKEEEIFKVFLAHWINHTGDHIKGYQEWVDKLKNTSRDDVSKEIEIAIEKLKSAQKKLMEAKIHF